MKQQQLILFSFIFVYLFFFFVKMITVCVKPQTFQMLLMSYLEHMEVKHLMHD